MFKVSVDLAESRMFGTGLSDDDWFEQQWHRHSSAVWAFARRRVGEAEAEEVVTDVYLVLWQKLPIRHELPWLLSVARNVIGTRYRSSQRQHKLLTRLSAQRSEDAATAPHSGLSVEEISVEVALEKLKPNEREAIRLVAWDGLSPSEAAAVVGCSASTFRMRLLRGRRRLRGLLADDESPLLQERKEQGNE